MFETTSFSFLRMIIFILFFENGYEVFAVAKVITSLKNAHISAICAKTLYLRDSQALCTLFTCLTRFAVEFVMYI